MHDICHKIKNAEISLERGTRFHERNTYKCTDLAVVLGSVKEKKYLKMDAVVLYKAVLQLEKQSHESALQKSSNNVTEVCWDIPNLVKTVALEIQRPRFSERHDFIDKPLFVAVSKCDMVFASNDYQQDVFFYRQSPLPR